jgi:outer membrane receptor for ferrienterochelin and colicins
MRYTLLIRALTLFILTASGYAIMSQSVDITGVVRDAESKQPLPYCNLALAGTTTGTTTDQNGRFSLSVKDPLDRKLVISFVGYTTDTVALHASRTQYTFYLKPDAKALNEVVVISGTMKEVTRMSSPIPVEIYSPALFQKNPVPSIFEALTMVNGVQPQLNCNVCNTGDIHINGMEGPYTMLLIDGMPVVSSLATVYGLSGIPNSMVKRIEVVKGPASTLYGSEAVGGLINIITKDPSGSPAFRADLSGTTLREYNADIATAFNAGKAKGLLGINYFNYQNLIDINDDNFTDVTQQHRISVFNKWDLKRQSERPASIALRYVYEDRWGGELQWNRSHRGSDQIYGESIFTNRFELIGNYELPASPARIALDYSYNYHAQDSWYGTVSYLAKQHVVFTQLRLNKTIGKHDILAGVPFRMIHYDDNTPGTAGEYGNDPAITRLPGIFVQDEYAAHQKLTVLSGIRYDRHNEHGNIFSPRLSFKYTPTGNHTVRLSAGNGFRVVNLFTEDHAALTGSRKVIIEEALKPEQSWNVNLNYAVMLPGKSGFTNMDFSVFYTHFTNKIVGDFLSEPDKIIYNNLNGYAVSKGMTWNSELTVMANLKFIGGVTVMDVYQVEDGVRQDQLFAPSFSGTWALSYSFLKPGITIDFTGRTYGPMALPVQRDFGDQRPDRSPWYSLANVQVTKIFNSGLELYGGVKNLFNFVPKDPLLHPEAPFSDQFDTTYNYAPVQGIKGFAGIRFTLQ